MDPEIVLPCRDRVEGFGRKHHPELVTLLFADMVGSAALKQKLGDQLGTDLVQQHHRLVRTILAAFSDGEEVDAAGDAFFLMFGTPSAAVKFALILQKRLREFNAQSPAPVQDRMGLHLGEVVIREAGQETAKGLMGLNVDLGARVMGLAQAGQILMTRPVFDNARQALKGADIPGIAPLSWLNHGQYQLKGIDEAVEICEVGEKGHSPLSAPATTEKAHRYATAEGELVLGWRPAVGDVVPNTQWVLEEHLDEGGFGEVWLAWHRQLKERRVFKFCFWADRIRSLKREVTLFHLLKQRAGEHPNIVRLYDVCFEQPPFYLEEEYVNGRDLRRWSEKQGGLAKVPLDTRLEIVAQAAEALQAAHDAGIIHRDVKPGNILVGGLWTSAGGPATLQIKLTDFGIAQVVSTEALAGITRTDFSRTQLSSTSSHTGTQLYIAPELMAGKPASTRSDIYALGVVLYQLLVGDFHRPVTTEWTGDVVDPLLRDDLKHCLAGNPSDRFAGAGQLAERLRSLAQRRRALVEQQALLEARERAAYRRGMLRTAAIVSVILAVIVFLAWQDVSRALIQVRQAAQIRSTTVRLTVANGLNPANNGDWLSAALWFAQAFVLDEAFQAASDAQLNQQTHRLRLNSVFRQSPRLEQIWFDTGNLSGGFDPSGQHVLLGGTNGYRLYSVLSSQAASPRVEAGCTRASLRPNGLHVVTGGGATNSLFTVWDVSSGAALFTLKEPGGDGPFRSDCQDLQFSPDGRWIAAALTGPEGRVVIWDADTGRARRLITYADAANVGWTKDVSILAARFDPSGERLLTTGTDSRAVVWQWETGRVLHVLRGHRSWIYGGCFGRRHTNWVVTCSFDRTARLWDLRTDQNLVHVEHEADAIVDVQFSPDDRAFLTGGLDFTARLWDSETGQLIPPIIRDHDRITQVQWSSDATHVLTVSYDGVARWWRLRPEKPIMESTSNDYSHDGRYALRLDRATAQVQEAATGRDLNAFLLTPAEARACSFAGGPDHLLYFSRPTHSMVADLMQVQLWQISRHMPVGPPFAYDSSWSRCLCAPGGRRVAFYDRAGDSAPADSGAGVLVWEPARAVKPSLIAFTNEDVTSVAFDPEGRRMAIASDLRSRPGGTSPAGGIVRLVDLEANQTPTVLLRSWMQIAQVTFSGDGKWLAAARWNSNLDPGDSVIWRVVEPGRPLAEVGRLVHLDGVRCTAFSDSGQTIATGSEDQTAIVWHWKKGAWQASSRPLHCGGQVYACSFSHNGRWLATAYRTPESQQSETWRSGIRIWDIASGEPVSLPFAFSETVTRLSFVAGDTRLFVEHWVSPAPPQRWIIDLAVNDGSPIEFLLRAELLSAQRPFLGDLARSPQASQADLSAEEALARATSVGPLWVLSKQDCRDLWLYVSAKFARPR